MRYFKLVVQYDGTDYAGYQIQPDVLTVQGELEAALGRVLGERSRTQAAGRTDGGVHARGQVVRVEAERPIPVEGLVRALNDTLPVAICVATGDEVAGSFHPRYDAIRKAYTYRILSRYERSPFLERYAWHIESPLDLDAMQGACRHLTGRHDFSAFAAAGSNKTDKVRCLERLECRREGEFIEIEAQGDGFLYMMVRNLVGTLVEVGQGRMAPGVPADVLASRDRSKAGPTAPPQGLFLMRVDY